MKLKEIQAKSIITKTNLPDGDFVINPYIGCMHGCKYCYAKFMKRFTGHLEEWGDFIDIKTNAADLIQTKTNKYHGKKIIIGSVTDPYQPIEKKYQLTRKILKKLLPLKIKLNILTKSDLITRDIDLLKKFKDCVVAISFSSLDYNLQKKLEPYASSYDKKISALKKLNQAKIKTVVFISPILPELTDWQKIVNQTKEFANEYWFENLNLYPSIKKDIYKLLEKIDPSLITKYNEIYLNNNYWDNEEIKIKEFCKTHKLNYRIYFHHKSKK